MRRLLIALLLVLIPAVASADSLVPGRPAGSSDYGTAVPLYDDPRYDPSAYTFEGAEWNSTAYATLYFWTNQMLIAKAWLLKSAIRVAEYALLEPVPSSLAASASDAMESVHILLWTGGAPLVMAGLGLAGLYALVLRLRGQLTRSWSVVGSVALVVLCAAVLAASGSGSLSTAATVTRHAGLPVYNAIGGPGLLARGGDAAWRVLVYEPWVMGELSDRGRVKYRSREGLDGGEFLAKTVTQRQNACLYNFVDGQADCPWWQVEFLPRRMLIAGFSGLATLVLAGALLLLAGGVLVAQLGLLLLLMLAPLWLVVALWWPGSAGRMLRWGASRLLGLLVGQVVLGATLGVFLTLSEAVVRSLPTLGWVLHASLLAVLGYLAMHYRYAWVHWAGGEVRRIHARASKQVSQVVERGREREQGKTEAAAERGAPAVVGVPSYGEIVVGAAALQVSPVWRHEESLATSVKELRKEAFRQEMRTLREQIVTQVYQGAEPTPAVAVPPKDEPISVLPRPARAPRERQPGFSEILAQRPQS